MKHWLYFLILFVPSQLVAQTSQGKKHEITFDTHQIDPNKMTSGKYTWSYKVHFKNTGDLPVIFSRCQCPAGCYVIGHYPKEVFMPGDTGYIELDFYYQTGMINKVAYLHTNIAEPAPMDGYKKYEFRLVGKIEGTENAIPLKGITPKNIPLVIEELNPVIFPTIK